MFPSRGRPCRIRDTPAMIMLASSNDVNARGTREASGSRVPTGSRPRPVLSGNSALRGNFSAAYSGGRRNALVFGDELIEFFAGGAVAEAFSGAVVEFVFDLLELGGGAGA